MAQNGNVAESNRSLDAETEAEQEQEEIIQHSLRGDPIEDDVGTQLSANDPEEQPQTNGEPITTQFSEVSLNGDSNGNVTEVVEAENQTEENANQVSDSVEVSPEQEGVDNESDHAPEPIEKDVLPLQKHLPEEPTIPSVNVNGALPYNPEVNGLESRETESPIDPASGAESPRIGDVRQPSIASVASGIATVNNTHIFKKVFETIISSKEAKKNESFKSTVQLAINTLNSPESKNPQIIFNALKATCETSHNSEIKALAIDLFAKLFDYAQFEEKSDKVKLTDASVDVIAECFEGEGTDPELELQVVRALMHSVLLMSCHGASLLKAVRQIYNVFIFSLSSRNQAVAQGILAQVISAIFQRISDSPSFKAKQSRSTSTNNVKSGAFSTDDLDIVPEPNLETREKLTLKTLERLQTDAYDDQRVNDANHASENDEDLAVKDAFLIFRAMCKLSVKSIETETIDMKSHAVRSKLLSLHIIHTILREHIEIFLSEDVVLLSSKSNERLITAVRQHISLALSRNAASPLAPVFELSLEIFWLIISNLRSEFKREIPVFWDEIYFPVAEIKTSTPHQKRYLLSIIERLCNDSRCIIEFYLNYDCDSGMPNICEKIIDFLTKLALIRIEVTPQQKLAYRENKRNGISVYDISKISNLTSSTMSSKPPEPEVYSYFPLEYSLKMTSIGCSVAFLRSLYSWVHKGVNTSSNAPSKPVSSSGTGNSSHLNLNRDRSGTVDSITSTGNNSRNASFVNTEQFNETDDPEQFENLKSRKRAFLTGIKLFNQKAKKGLNYFLEQGFITSLDSQSVAEFLLETDGLDKSVIGEYLGEAHDENIATMHAFVDLMEFSKTEFVDSLRKFLQAFRLPGEAQKIDRFMLKFAERYVLGNPTVFSNADAAYILAYSTILLNTDLHSPQIKVRMTFENFVSNNAGIDDGKDLPVELLRKTYDQISSNEIKLHSEQHAALLAGDIAVSTPGSSVGFFGSRDLNREAYNHASKEMSNKTENLVLKLKSDNSNGVFYVASHVHHVKSIFNTVWMSILAGVTPPFKEYDEEDITKICLEGIKLSIKISCIFDLEYARTSFIGALVQFENLNNYEEMKSKNVDAIYILLELAVSEGNSLHGSWEQVLVSISQLERLQLIAQGVDQDSIPDVSVAKLVNRGSIDSSSRASTSFFSSFTSQSASQTASNKFHNQHLTPYVAHLLTKTELDVAIDKVYTNSANLTGESIVEFVKALSNVASEEIESSGQSSNPRTFSLQKVVDICYYNMNRIRLEWSQLWATMGETFNTVGCHSNSVISFFALDSLRQLSMRFLEIDELAHFKFQKEFLKPFEYVILHNDSLEVKDMVLECINNMILGRADKIKSGWKTIFGVLTAAAKEKKESMVMKSYKMASWINKEYSEEVRSQDSFADLVICFTELAKNERFQRASLLSLDVLSKLINQVAQLSFGDKSDTEKTLSVNGIDDEKSDHLVKLWFPVLFGFHDIIMTGEELEVRSRALSYLFNILLDYGEYFEGDFWDMICHQLLFPIFSVLSNHWELSAEDTNDKLSVWLSTTLIQALKSMITLFTHYFEPLTKLLDGYLNLIISCICQENDTIARIGRESLSTLLLENATKFSTGQWDQITDALASLFELTTARELYTSDPLRNNVTEDAEEGGDVGSNLELNITQSPKAALLDDTEARLRKSKDKSSIVVKSILQLLLIQTLSELFQNDDFYEAVPYTHLMNMASLLTKSYEFAKEFNADYDLRVRLWNARVIERLPNLLKQESYASAVLINVMFRMYCDDDKTSTEDKGTIMNTIIPVCQDIADAYAEYDETNQQRHISSWKPVIIEIYQGYVELDDEDFVKYAPSLYDSSLKSLTRSMPADYRLALRTFLNRVGEEFIKPRV